MKMITYSHYNADPYFNMAFDEWMFQRVIDEKSLICLRLYSWSIGTITFGYNQQISKAFDHLRLNQTPVIRRVTGGRGLFHDESELTYSIAISSDLIEKKIVSESISGASSEIAKILVFFLKQLNISSDYIRHAPESDKNKTFFLQAPCFASFSKNEIVTDNKKIIASAQRRVLGSLLQHGSIKINGFKHHDALPLGSVNSMEQKEIKKMTDANFHKYLPVFFDTFSKAFVVKYVSGVLTEKEKNNFDNKKKIVLKKSLEKRDFIKQGECC